MPTCGAVPLDPQFNFTKWWNIQEGERIRGPFDVRDELIPKLLHVLEKVCGFSRLLVLN